MKKVLIFSLIAIVLLVSCKKKGCTDPTAINYSSEAKKDDGSCTYEADPEPEPEASPVLLGTGTTTANETVKLYADDSLYNEYTNLYAEVSDASGNIISNATVAFAPLMDMGMMQHACPTIQPVFNAATEMYEGVVIFQMSSVGGTWTIDVVVNGDPVTFNINVSEAPTKLVGVYTGTDSKQYIVSFVQPKNWIVGSQAFDIMIHEKATMMSFPEVTNMDIVFWPEMVSMGHSSTGNVDPVHVANGLYSGTVNLSMAGDWRFHLELSQNSTVIHSDAFLDILF